MDFAQATGAQRDWNSAAQILKALGHPVRLKIVVGLVRGSCNVGRIWQCLGLPQATVSQHLRVLRQEGILDSERQGKEVVYTVSDSRVRDIIDSLGLTSH